MVREGYFINHCEEENCGLGTFEFNCPECNKYNINYDLWWEQNNMPMKVKINTVCEHCNSNLQIENKDYQYKITKL